MRKVVFGLILAVGVALFPAASAHADTVSDEAAFVAKINDLRASKGLPALQVNANLVSKARGWAAGMAGAGRIWHSALSDGITEDWKKLGENVGMGGSVAGLHAAFVASPHHYENLVDPSFGAIGIGIVMNGDTIYVSEMFMQLMPAKSTPVVNTGTTAPPVTTTTAPKPATPKKPAAQKPAAAKPAAPKAPAAVPQAPVAPAAPPVAAPTPPPAPAVTPAAPADPPRTPSALLVSVLERLRTFDS